VKREYDLEGILIENIAHVKGDFSGSHFKKDVEVPYATPKLYPLSCSSLFLA
jgi:hypothetical protein